MKISEFIPLLEKHRNGHFGDNSKTIRVINALRTYLNQDSHKIYVKDLKFADLQMRNFSHKSWLHFLDLKEELCKTNVEVQMLIGKSTRVIKRT